MSNDEFKILLKEAGLSKKAFAELIETSSQVVNNWNVEGRDIPYWVKSWLKNYIKAKSYEDVKDKVFEIENIKE